MLPNLEKGIGEIMRFVADEDYSRKDFTPSEQKLLNKIRENVRDTTSLYMFWFIYKGGLAVDWEGGYALLTDSEFRNTFTVSPDGKLVHCNFDEE